MCAENLRVLDHEQALLFYLCPERRISFDRFVNYEGRRFGVSFHYRNATARIMRKDDLIYTYSVDLKQLIAIHEVNWSMRDRFCADQYFTAEQPEEFPVAPVKTEIAMLPEPNVNLSFERFNFEKDVDWDK